MNQVDAMKAMVNEFSEYARAPSANMTKINLNQLITDVSGLYENSQAIITYELAEKMPDLLGDATMLRQLLHNLMQNAQDALDGQQSPAIRVKTTWDDTSIHLEVRDNGQGFAEHVFVNP